MKALTTGANARASLVYSTDSNYICFPHKKSGEEIWDYALHVGEELTKMFPAPIVLEFEQEIYSKFLILSKKRYMYRKCERDGEVDMKIGKKGVLLARRDNSKFIRDVYEHVVIMIMDGKSQAETLDYVIDEINELCSGMKPLSDFVVTKAIGDSGGCHPIPQSDGKTRCGDYIVSVLSADKNIRDQEMEKKEVDNERDFYLTQLPGHIQLAEKMRNRGARVDNGERLEYVISNPDQHTAKQGAKLESFDYIKKHSDVVKIDFMYYLKALANPLDAMLNVAFNKTDKNKDFVLLQYNLRAKYRVKLMSEINSISLPKLVFKED